MAKYHSNSAYPPKFLVEFEAKYLPQIAPEAVSEHEYVKISWGGACPQTPLEVLGFSSNSGFAIVQPPQIKMSRFALVWPGTRLWYSAKDLLHVGGASKATQGSVQYDVNRMSKATLCACNVHS